MLLEGAELSIHTGQKWGLIGANGCGKSSLFKLFLGELHEDTGSCLIPKEWQISHMAQEVGVKDCSALDYVLDGDSELRDTERAIEHANESETQDGEKLATLYAKMETIDGYTATSRAQKLLQGLGFKHSDENRAVGDFSGGWRIRLNLAKALMCRSDFLLLDEPTNHLDLDATIWLEKWLQRYSGTLIIISHDRDFLDNVVSSIVNIDQGKLIAYAGNYSAYEKQKVERLAQQAAAYSKQQERIAEIENFVRRFRAKATKAKQAQSRLKELERMEKIAAAHIDSPFSFRFPEPEKIPQNMITLDEASIGYKGDDKPDKVIAKNIELSILDSSRIGLLGHNGAGKSTLIKTLTGSLSLVSGERVDGAHLKIGYFAQHQLESLDPKASCALHLQRLTPTATEQEIRNFLGGFDFQGDRAFEEIAHFSGGEKARLALAIVAWQKPNLLILDEPTNHLDLEMRHALTLALQSFEGAIIIVSHDRHLLKNTVDNFLFVNDGKVSPFDGTLDDYLALVKNQNSDSGNETMGENNSPLDNSPAPSKESKKNQRQALAAAREKLKPLTNAIKKLEKDIASLQTTLDKLEEKLADNSLYDNPGSKLSELLKEQATTQALLEEKEELWMEKSEELENLS